MRSRCVLSLALALGIPAVTAAQTSLAVPPDSVGAAAAVAAARARTATAVRAERPPTLDGRDDDPVWRAAQVVDGFREWDPVEDGAPRYRTTARIAYDDRALYVFVRAYDPRPDSIVALLSRRDVSTASDKIAVVLDSYHDRRTGYLFMVNPAGVKVDGIFYNDDTEDDSWEGVWDVATRVDSAGWTAEFRIPFSQLRFPEEPTLTFGLAVLRDIARTKERLAWPIFRRSRPGVISQLGELDGLRRVPAPRRLELTPYAITKNVSEVRSDGVTHPQRVTAGLDMKVGLSSNLTLDATVNPDFGQVEADPAVLNLSAFEQFYQERRPFFLEGTGIFRFDLSCNDGACQGLFYSRRIGRAPQLLGPFGDATSPAATTVLGAAKITGRTARGLSVGVLDAVTAREEGPAGITLEPLSNYAVARVQQDLRGGASGVGVMFTSVTRDLADTASGWLRDQAYAVGVDARHRFLAGRYEVSGYAAGSRVRASQAAMERLQACTGYSCVHNYARPDGRLRVDSTRTVLTGNVVAAGLSKLSGLIRASVGYQRVSPGFETNDMGFLTRDDQQALNAWMGLRFNNPRWFYRQASLNVNQWSNYTTGGLRTNVGGNVNGQVQLRSNWWVNGGYGVNDLVPVACDRCARGGPAVRQSPSWFAWGGVRGDDRRPIAPYLYANLAGGDEGRSHDWALTPGVDLRAGSRIRGSLELDWARGVNDAQWWGNVADSAGVTHYTFARLEQTRVALTARLDAALSPALSLQLYAQPFRALGTYADWRELADPRAASYTERYRPYGAGGDPGGFDFRQFRSNAVLRWEYRPGSTLFLVWSQGRTGYLDGAPTATQRRDYGGVFDLWPDNTLLVKVSYWMNP